MRQCIVVALAIGAMAGMSLAQQTTPSQVVVERLRTTGLLEDQKWRRGDDGSLEMWFWCDVGDPAKGRFIPVVGKDPGELFAGLQYSGLLQMFSLVNHGNGDLLGMTDANQHFRALGIGIEDVELRQFLALPMPAFVGRLGRAELLDRLLAIDVLERRACRSAIVELQGLVRRDEVPAVLRERAARAMAAMRGEPVPPRLRLASAAVRLPATFDACVVIEHGKLPDLSWLNAAGQRAGALVTARTLERAGGGECSLAQLNGLVRQTAKAGELPFAIAHRLGNVRLDHSCFVISLQAGPDAPVALTWQAAGAIDAEGWAAAGLSGDAAHGQPWFGGTLAMAADGLFASTDRSQSQPRPELVEKFGLLRDEGSAVRAIVPANSRLWGVWRAALNLPFADRAEVRIVCGDPATIVVSVAARDEAGAAAWSQRGKELLAELRQWLDERAPVERFDAPTTFALFDALFAAELHAVGSQATATITLTGMTAQKAQAIVEELPWMNG
ncbi:MAG: hypothetical protein IT455_05845 [Planctomycetes bacterium]|nr:hypothetical protein [Planctomycetota bacterium]